MNFPGLDPAWKLFHRCLHGAGAIQPWTQEECRNSITQSEGILVVATTALGDTILCTPLLQSLTGALGEGRVDFLVRRSYASLYEGYPKLGAVHTVGGKYRGLMDVKRSLQGRGMRMALMATTTEPDLIPWLWHCGIRGFLRHQNRWSQWPSWFANRPMMKQPGEDGYGCGHAVDNTLAMAQALGITPSCRELLITVDDPASVRLESGTYFMVHPGASRPRKRWPVERWIHVVRRMQAASGKHCVVTGGMDEFRIAGQICRAVGEKCHNLAGKLSLNQLAAWQRRAALFVSGDTGPYHLAVAVRCPTVTLFAPTDRGSSSEACGPKYADPTRHRTLEISSFDADIKEIEVDAVLRESLQILIKP